MAKKQAATNTAPRYEIELRESEATQIEKPNWRVRSPSGYQILVDGIFVGYASRRPQGGVNIVGRVPGDVEEAISKAVEEKWGEAPNNVNQLNTIENQEDDEQT